MGLESWLVCARRILAADHVHACSFQTCFKTLSIICNWLLCGESGWLFPFPCSHIAFQVFQIFLIVLFRLLVSRRNTWSSITHICYASDYLSLTYDIDCSYQVHTNTIINDFLYLISRSTKMPLKCSTGIFAQWPLSGCNAAYWGLAIAALIFTYQYHRSATALYARHEKTSTILPDHHSDSGFGSSCRQQPLANGLNLSMSAWRVATYLVFISQTFVAIFAAQLTYGWLHTLHEWALRQENGSRPVIMQVSPLTTAVHHPYLQTLKKQHPPGPLYPLFSSRKRLTAHVYIYLIDSTPYFYVSG